MNDMSEKGYILYQCNHLEGPGPELDQIAEINSWRSRLHSQGVIGIYDNGIGFGNISTRIGQSDLFYISGTCTGAEAQLKPEHYSEVKSYSIENNTLTCLGAVKASSESLSHAAVYRCLPECRVVIHIHHQKLWESSLDVLPTTGHSIEAATPEMAFEIERLLGETLAKKTGIFVMGGHQEGLIAFGKTADEAGEIVLEHLDRLAG